MLIHDLADERHSMGAAVSDLSQAARVIAYSRRGYGASSAPEPYTGTTVQEQAQDAAALLGELAPGGATVAGQGFGALIALDLMLRHGMLVHGAVLADPLLLAFVPEATRQLSDERLAIESAVRDGGLSAGVDAWLGDDVAGERRERAHAAAGAFFADYAGIASWPVTRSELRSLTAPVTILTGPASRPYVRPAAQALAALLPNATERHDGDLTAAARELLSAT